MRNSFIWCIVCFFFVVAPFSLALDPEKLITQYTLDVYIEQSGLDQTSINATAQTGDGYIWLGTEDGMVRFNGKTFSLFNKNNTNAIKENYILCMAEDSNGVLWMGSYGEGLVTYDKGLFESFAFNSDLSERTIFSLLADRNGNIWAGTFQKGLNLIQGQKITVLNESNGLPSDMNIRALFEDRDGVIWVGTQNGLCTIKDGKIQSVDLPKEINHHIFSICQGLDGDIWVGTMGAGLIRISKGGFRTYNKRDGLLSSMIRSVYSDHDGNIWVGTNEAGICLWKNDRFEYVQMSDGLSNNTVTGFFEDREHTLWVSTKDGLNHFIDASVTTFSKREGLLADLVRCVSIDESGTIWIGTNTDGLIQMKGKQFQSFDSGKELQSGSVFAVHKDRKGDLWIGTYGKGLKIVSPNGQIKHISTENGLADNYVRAIFEASDGGVWVGTKKGVQRFKDRAIDHLHDGNGLSHNYTRFITETADGSIWVGAYTGLNKIKDGAIQIYNKRDGLNSDNVTTLYEDKEGVIWIGTYRGGLIRMKDERFFAFTTDNGFFSDDVYSILEDDYGNLWMSCNHGIFMASREELNQFADGQITEIHIRSFGKTDGMKSSHCGNGIQQVACKGPDGDLWFTSLKGLVNVKPSRLIEPPVAPMVTIEKIFVDRKERELENRIILSPGRRDVDFHFAALSYVSPSVTRYRYQLVNYDENWIEAGKRTVAYYTNLPPGEYTFKVQASTGKMGQWSTAPAGLHITKTPFFFQQLKFQVGAFGVLLLIIILLHQWRLVGLKRRGVELQKQVDLQTGHLKNEKEKTESLLAETQRANAFKAEVMGMAAHDLRNPLNAVLSYAKIIEDKLDDDSPVLQELEYIQSSSYSMVELISSLLERADTTHSTINLTIKEFQFKHVLYESLFCLEPAAEKKKQQIDLHCDQMCMMEGDATRVREVVENLIGNAIKYAPIASTVKVSARETTDSIVFSVSDSGPGISEEDQSKLFKKFTPLSTTPTDGEASLGLGLYIAKKVVDRHNGRISMKNIAGGGCQFTVILPRSFRA